MNFIGRLLVYNRELDIGEPFELDVETYFSTFFYPADSGVDLAAFRRRGAHALSLYLVTNAFWLPNGKHVDLTPTVQSTAQDHSIRHIKAIPIREGLHEVEFLVFFVGTFAFSTTITANIIKTIDVESTNRVVPVT